MRPRSFISEDRMYGDLTPDLMQAARIPQRFWGASMASVPEADDHREKIVAFIGNLKTNIEAGIGLRIHGDHGTGKTSLAVIIAKEAAARSARVLFLLACDVAAARIEGATFSLEWTLAERMRSVDLLVIDDMGASHPSDWAQSEMESLLRERYHDLKTTIVTTNRSPSDLKKSLSEGAWQALSRGTVEIKVSGKQWGRVEAMKMSTKAFGGDS